MQTIKTAIIHNGLASFIVLMLVVLITLPMIALFGLGIGNSQEIWGHLLETVFPRYLRNTVVLTLGCGFVALMFGAGSGWLLSRYQFFGHRVLDFMLLLPAAVPAYITAYAYTNFLEYAGPVQSWLREFFGWENARGYWFFDIRSMEGAILVMGSVLYPYVYILTRLAFRRMPQSLFETARLQGQSVFWDVALPMARPAIVMGLALVSMEVVSDFGVVEYFAIETLALGVYNVWLGMNNLAAAAQLSMIAFSVIFILLAIELISRRNQRYADMRRNFEPSRPNQLHGWKSMTCCILCMIPVIIGFLVPVTIIITYAVRKYDVQEQMLLLSIGQNSLMIAALTTVILVFCATIMVVMSRFRTGAVVQNIANLSTFGYAVPGTMLALGVLIVAGLVDEGLVGLARFFGFEIRAILSGTIILLVLAYMARFQVFSFGTIDNGIKNLPGNLVAASRLLGAGLVQSIIRVVMPLLHKFFLASALLVFVEVMKELPMTLLLRPFDFHSLATYTYQYASDEQLSRAALPALAIIMTGLIPILLLNSFLKR
ncbi:MAG: iron ABC transporter permease [Pseudomonadota bacterium]